MTGRKDSECGQMGVKRMAGTLGCTIDPPAATLYAVLPVGVASITPSACTCARAGAGMLSARDGRRTLGCRPRHTCHALFPRSRCLYTEG